MYELADAGGTCFERSTNTAVLDHDRQTASYPNAIRRLQSEGLLPQDVEHRTSKYLNTIIEADHGALKPVIRPTRGFQTMKTAAVALMGFETMRMIRRGHCSQRKRQVMGEVRLVNQFFGLVLQPE
ncbi:DDE-type integrase/transposase/recombinase [Microvirga sp. BSC39]|uniref:DDE-type integrase/transposase/recombinase n=1 Tax=Microvirga sp. BSC39 TaxID=1549810 RepID=UPI00068FC0C8|nr:DDE-type integrase/transposase/recombinase [Microvirga sp. BSC39]